MTHRTNLRACTSPPPRDVDKLLPHQAGFLAQKRLARGVRLNYPKAVALIATQILEFIRDGRSVAELMDLGRRLLGRAQVTKGVGLDEVVDHLLGAWRKQTGRAPPEAPAGRHALPRVREGMPGAGTPTQRLLSGSAG